MQLFTLNDIKIELQKFTYSPGDVITGKVITYLKDRTKADEIRLRFYGTASINTEKTTYTHNGNLSIAGREEVQFGGQEMILAGPGTYISYEYPFSIRIPVDIFPRASPGITELPQDSSGWEKITTDIVSQLTGVRQFIPTYRFFLDVSMDIPWGADIQNSTEISVTHSASPLV